MAEARREVDLLAGVAVVVVTFNSADHVAAGLHSLATERLAGVVVVDNRSADDTVEVVRRLHLHNVEVLALDENLGFGAGCNLGEAAAPSSRWVLFLNPDASIRPADLEALAAYAATTPGVGMVAPRLFDGDTPLHSAGRLATVATELRYALPRALKAFAPDRRHPPAYDRTGPVGYVEGACMLADREAFAAVGRFDERYFLFFEEQDLARRLRAAGYSVHLFAGASAQHQVGSSRASAGFGARPHYVASTVAYLERWHGPRAADRYRRAARLIWTVGARSGRLDRATATAWRDALDGAPPR